MNESYYVRVLEVGRLLTTKLALYTLLGTLPQMQTFVTHPTSFAGAAAHFVIVDPAKLVPGPDKVFSITSRQ